MKKLNTLSIAEVQVRAPFDYGYLLLCIHKFQHAHYSRATVAHLLTLSCPGVRIFKFYLSSWLGNLQSLFGGGGGGLSGVGEREKKFGNLNS